MPPWKPAEIGGRFDFASFYYIEDDADSAILVFLKYISLAIFIWRRLSISAMWLLYQPREAFNTNAYGTAKMEAAAV